MIDTVAEIIPLAIGIAINPIAIIAFIAVLSSSDGLICGLGLVCGWLLALFGLVSFGNALASNQHHQSSSEPSGAVAWLIGLVGVAMIAAAVLTWRRRSSWESFSRPPRWIRSVSQFSALQSFLFGIFLVMFSFKNLTLAATAGVIIAAGQLDSMEFVAVLIGFLVVSTLGLLVPLSIAMVQRHSSSATLMHWREWLIIHNATITGSVLLAMGAHLMRTGAKGI